MTTMMTTSAGAAPLRAALQSPPAHALDWHANVVMAAPVRRHTLTRPLGKRRALMVPKGEEEEEDRGTEVVPGTAALRTGPETGTGACCAVVPITAGPGDVCCYCLFGDRFLHDTICIYRYVVVVAKAM